MAKNTTPEAFDDTIATEDGAANLDKEQLLMSENDILKGLLELGNERNDEANYKPIEIRRNGRLVLAFRIRPLTEDENQICLRRATKYAANKPGQPKVAIETNASKYRSHMIYTATVDEDRKKIWDNKEAQKQLNVLQATDLIDCVLLAGEKSRIIDIIDSISGWNEEVDELAKN